MVFTVLSIAIDSKVNRLESFWVAYYIYTIVHLVTSH